MKEARRARRAQLVMLCSLGCVLGACGGGDAAKTSGAGGSAGNGGSSAGPSAAAGQAGSSVGPDVKAGASAAAGSSGSSGRDAGSSARAAAGAASGSNAGSSANGTLINPAPGGKLFVGANFWNVEWEGAGDYFASGVNWATTQNPWNPTFLADLAPYHVLRFMDWNLTNEANNAQANWDTRPKQTDAQKEPIAFEWQIDLCNRAKQDYWVTIPHQANAEYFAKLAQLIHDKLDPGLRVYVEWSNEVWNGTFPQRAYAQTQGKNLGLAGTDPAASFLVYQSVRAFEAFEAVFGKGSPRLVKVIAGQAASSGPCQAHVKALSDAKINPNHTQPTVYAVAPYIKGNSVSDLSSKGIPEVTTWIQDNYKCASGAGLPLIAYEGGQDSYAAGVSACTQLQHDAGLHDVYTKFLDAMVSAKLSGPLMQYTHSGQCWGLKEKTSDTLDKSPKYKGVVDWLAAHP